MVHYYWVVLMVDSSVGNGIAPIRNLVVDLETALGSDANCIVQESNPGYTNKFLDMTERSSPHFVLLGGHRVAGKTTIVDTLVDKVNRNFVKVKTHVTRQERRTERLF